MADDHERPGPAVEQVLERRQRVDVEIVRRLVEQQHVRLGHHQAHQLQPPALAAREIRDERPLAVADEAEALAQLRGRQLASVAERDPRAHRLERLEHALPSDELLELLRERPETHGRAAPDLAARRLELAGEQPQQRRLARAVDADEPDAVARTEPPRDVLQEPAVAERQADVLDVEDRLAETRAREAEQLGAVAGDGLVGDQRVGRGDAEAGLRGAGGRAAAEPGELLAQEVLAAALADRGDAIALGAREHPLGVAALVLAHRAAVDLPRLRADGVEEPAIVGDHDEGAAARSEVARRASRPPRGRGGSSARRAAAAPGRRAGASPARYDVAHPPRAARSSCRGPSGKREMATPPIVPSSTSRIRRSPAHS